MKYLCLALVFLLACTTTHEVMSRPAAQEPPQEPIVVPAPLVEPRIEPSVPPPAVPFPPLTELSCTEGCEQQCQLDAQRACTQPQRSQCKSLCGTIINPSACTQACTYLSQPNVCKQQFVNFCSSQCIALCR